MKEIWKYRDLLFLFVRRDIVAVYKQTILGPAWFFIQPILTSIVFTLVFGGMAGLPSDGLPHMLFYLSGIIVWNYFAESFISTSKTFTENAGIFGKVYFPRIVMPLSKIISGLLRFFIQILLLITVYVFFLAKGEEIAPNGYVLLIPLLIILMIGFGLGFGMIFSAMTTKYRDLTFLITFGVQLLMFLTPTIIPMSKLAEKKYKVLILLNPMTSIIETFRFGIFGKGGSVEPSQLLYSTLFMIFILFSGVIIFNKVEKSFIDTV
ncbi:MAG: ABC transporter permease [Cytophagaceae bacterium]|nr:ABC transporter permease [Cytophagaceae bacterium]